MFREGAIDMPVTLLADMFSEQVGERTILRAMPLLLIVLGILAIAYRYYSAFLAAKVAVLDDRWITPAHTLNDGQNYHPTNKWVLFGHHFAAISGAGPLIGPVLAIQYGYMPGLLWLVIGVCLAGAVQDMLVLAASVRRQGKSLAEIARTELGPWANAVVSAAILFIVVIALAGLGFVVAQGVLLGGEEVRLAFRTEVYLPAEGNLELVESNTIHHRYRFPKGCVIHYPVSNVKVPRPEQFVIEYAEDASPLTVRGPERKCVLPEGSRQLVPGSSWGTFTIACTIPIALFVGLYMYKIRKGRVLEGSLIGAVAVLAATVGGNWIPGSPLEDWFRLTKGETVLALCGYGFIASVLPVWLLLCPRDYLSSFLKIGTIALLVVGVLVANPTLPCPMVNPIFSSSAGGPTFPGGLFPFVFICIMCGSISGFHSLVASGTTPKMIDKETQVRPIGYGEMLIEGIVGVVALITAASLDPKLYYDINVDQRRAEKFEPAGTALQGNVSRPGLDFRQGGPNQESTDPFQRRQPAICSTSTYRQGGPGPGRRAGGATNPLRGRTGGAVTLAVGMALIFTRRGTRSHRRAHRRHHEILVPLRHHVRGPVHPHDHRYRHAHRPFSAAGNDGENTSEV